MGMLAGMLPALAGQVLKKETQKGRELIVRMMEGIREDYLQGNLTARDYIQRMDGISYESCRLLDPISSLKNLHSEAPVREELGHYERELGAFLSDVNQVDYLYRIGKELEDGEHSLDRIDARYLRALLHDFEMGGGHIGDEKVRERVKACMLEIYQDVGELVGTKADLPGYKIRRDQLSVEDEELIQNTLSSPDHYRLEGDVYTLAVTPFVVGFMNCWMPSLDVRRDYIQHYNQQEAKW